MSKSHYFLNDVTSVSCVVQRTFCGSLFSAEQHVDWRNTSMYHSHVRICRIWHGIKGYASQVYQCQTQIVSNLNCMFVQGRTQGRTSAP